MSDFLFGVCLPLAVEFLVIILVAIYGGNRK